jgi:stage III sporulation protein AF
VKEMLTHLKIWIENLVVIVLLTSFVELLLPRSQLEKYTRVVLGLFVVIAILNPVLNLFQSNYNFQHITELLTVEEERTEMPEIRQQGEELKQSNQREVRKNYKKQIAKQIMAILSFDDEVTPARVDVNLRSDNQIKNIVVNLKKKDDLVNNSKKIQQIEVAKVRVDGKKDNDKVDKYNDNTKLMFNRKIKERLANFYGLSINQIFVQAE